MLTRLLSSAPLMALRRALIVGSSGGIGRALKAHFQGLGWHVVGLSRSEHGFDVTVEESVQSHFQKLDGHFDRVVVATGGLEIGGISPEKSLQQLSAEGMEQQFQLNAIGPALCLKHGATKLLSRTSPSVFAVLSARVGSIGDNRLGGWYSYRAAKAAVNQMVHGAAIEVARTHRQAAVVALHPGTVKTPLTQKYVGRHPAVEPHEAAANLARVMDGLTPDDSGSFFDWAGERVPW